MKSILFSSLPVLIIAVIVVTVIAITSSGTGRTRWLKVLVLLACAALFGYGWLASFEQAGLTTWKIGYGLGTCIALIAAVRVIVFPRRD